MSGERVEPTAILHTVPVPLYGGNGPGRILNWITYAVLSVVSGLRTGRSISLVYGSSPHLLAGLAAYVVAKVRRVPFVIEVRDLWPHILIEAGLLNATDVTYRLLKILERFLYRKASAIVILAEGSRQHIEDEGVPSHKIAFVPNGADPELFEVETPRETLRSQFGFDQFTVIYTGAHGPANGLDLALDAAAELEDEGVPFKLVLVGDGVAKPALLERSRSMGLQSVRFMDPVPKREIGPLLAAADAGLHCLADVPLFRSAVSPNKLFDYMAAGIPVLTNTGGDVGRLVGESGSGSAVAPGCIADGIRELLASSPDELAVMGRNGRAQIEAHHSRRKMAERLEELLDSLVTG